MENLPAMGVEEHTKVNIYGHVSTNRVNRAAETYCTNTDQIFANVSSEKMIQVVLNVQSSMPTFFKTAMRV